MFGGTPPDGNFFATGSLLQKWDPHLKKTKALFCMEINKQHAGRAVGFSFAEFSLWTTEGVQLACFKNFLGTD